MSDEKTGTNWFDLATKTIPILVAIGSFLWGIYQFNEGRRRDALTNFHKTVWELRLKNYEKIADTVGNVMKNRNSPKEFEKSKAEFEKAYFAGMVLVEDDTVDRAMVSLRSVLEDYVPEAEGHEEMLEKAALRVVGVCRSHIMAEKRRIEGAAVDRTGGEGGGGYFIGLVLGLFALSYPVLTWLNIVSSPLKPGFLN